MGSGVLVYEAARDVAAGEELLVPYGRRAKDETHLLLDYGFRREFVSPCKQRGWLMRGADWLVQWSTP